MSGKTIGYWIATVLFAAFMAFDAYAYLSHNPKMVSALSILGYPVYFINILGTAKTLGVIAILAPRTPRLKEWAYAGFTFTFIGAFVSHLSAGQQKESIMPLVALVIMVVSYLLRPPDRRTVEAFSF